MNKAEFIKSLEGLAEELKNEPTPVLDDATILKIYKLAWNDVLEYVEFELNNSSVTYEEEFNLSQVPYGGNIEISVHIDKEIDLSETDFIEDFIELVKSDRHNSLVGAVDRIKEEIFPQSIGELVVVPNTGE